MLNTPQPQASIPGEAYVFTLQEILKTPEVTKVSLIQQPQGSQLVDAMQAPITDGLTGDIFEQVFDPKTYTTNNAAVKILPGNAVRMFEVWGTIPRPVIPAPGMLGPLLTKMRGGKPIPIVLLWVSLNVDTFEYHAVSHGFPQGVTHSAPSKKLDTGC